MPFTEIGEIEGPFLMGAVWHPKEDLFQIGSSTFNMAMSYHRIFCDHLADHLIYFSSSSSFWFSLNSSYEHDFHLSKRLGMTPKDYKNLLVAVDQFYFRMKHRTRKNSSVS